MQGLRAQKEVLADDGVKHDLQKHRGNEEEGALEQLVGQVVAVVREAQQAQLHGKDGAWVGHSVEESRGQGESEGQWPYHPDCPKDSSAAAK